MGSETYHEPLELLSEETKDLHRAIVSLKEELEAVDWYQQRAEASADPELRAVLIHNKNEEIEHAIMNLEWIRRHSEVFDRNLRTYLYTEGPITDVEAAKAGAASEEAPAANGAGKVSPGSSRTRPSSHQGSLGIGSLKG